MRFKLNILLFFSVFALAASAQSETFDFFYNKGLDEFNKKTGKPDYAYVCNYLEKALAIDSSNQELNYFLGYAYDRRNAEDGNQIPNMLDPLSIKASEYIERCIAIGPIYSGKKLALDPYSKLSSIWGALGFKYLSKGQLDTVAIVLEEGKRRGAFPEPLLEYHRTCLKKLPEDAVLLSSGDNFTYPLLYLQAVENMRPDVAVVDVNMLNSNWYPVQIKNLYPELIVMPTEDLLEVTTKPWQKKWFTFSFFGEVEPDLPKERDFTPRAQKRKEDEEDYQDYLDELEEEKQEYEEEVAWAYEDMDDPELLAEFSWELEPSTYTDSTGFLLRGDQILLEILGNSIYTRPVYTTLGFPSERMLSLDNFFFNEGLARVFIFYPEDNGDRKLNRKIIFKNLSNFDINNLNDPMVKHSEDMVRFMNFYRLGFIEGMESWNLAKNKGKREKLREQMIQVIPKDLVPFYPKDLMNRLGF